MTEQLALFAAVRDPDAVAYEMWMARRNSTEIAAALGITEVSAFHVINRALNDRAPPLPKWSDAE